MKKWLKKKLINLLEIKKLREDLFTTTDDLWDHADSKASASELDALRGDILHLESQVQSQAAHWAGEIARFQDKNNNTKGEDELNFYEKALNKLKSQFLSSDSISEQEKLIKMITSIQRGFKIK